MAPHPLSEMSEEDALRILVERYRDAVLQIIKQRCEDSDRRIAALEARVIVAEGISKTATDQMAAVLAVLNVLSHLAPARPALPFKGNT